MRPGAVAALALVAGIGIGTAVDRTPPRQPVRSGDEWILSGDFHVHASPGDGSLTPFSLRDEAARAGLDVFAVTNHNQFLAPRLLRWMAPAADAPIVIAGEEITDPDYHLIAVGIHEAVAPGPPVAQVVAEIHRQGGIAIAAHPSASFGGYDDAALAAVDGTEVAHPAYFEKYHREFAEVFARAKGLNPHVAPIGSSDFHNNPALGECRTFVFSRERSAAGVLDAIREGRTVALDERGVFYGDPVLIERVRRTPPTGRTDAHRPWRRLSIALAWCGLAGLVLMA
jgi:predicted metal-dependent phosphoesterase TrpH